MLSATARTPLVCLLPARNCAEDLPGYFESVGRFADAVIALDDGSSDATGARLRAEELVHTVLANPPRASYRGWNDAENRQRLLDAAVELAPDWVLFLDADERIASDDGAALREFLARDAVRGLAYGFSVFRMIGDLDHYDRSELCVYRLFAHEAGQVLPRERLHLVPVPTSIPRSRWLRTSLRIQHLASLDDARRHRRFRKYMEADPAAAFQADYSNLLAPPDSLRRWEPRPAGLSVMALASEANRRYVSIDKRSVDAPVLSAIVISRNDEQRIERAVGSVVRQECPEPFEVIVVTSGDDRTADIVREKFPQVKLVELERPALPGEARNAGLRVARGDYVSFPGSHVELPPGSLAARIRAHRAGYAMVTGSMLCGTRTWSGWASYFLDHSGALPGRPSGVLPGPPASCSYDRGLLLAVGGFPEDRRAGEDTVVNRKLARRGCTGYRAQDVVLTHHSPCRTPVRLLRHHFTRGRALGRIIMDDHASGCLVDDEIRSHLVRYLPRRLSRATKNVMRWGGRQRSRYVLTFPLVAAGAAAAWAGTWYELLRPARGKARVLFGDTRGAATPTVSLGLRRSGR